MTYQSGDKVRCRTNLPGQFTKDKIYTVRKQSAYMVFVVEDDNGSTTNGWDERNFELVKPEEPEVFMVLRYGNVWNSPFETQKEAEESIGHGGEFEIVKLVRRVKTQVTLVDA